MPVETEVFGTTPKGQTVTLYTLRNKQGLELQMIDYGAIVVSMKTPDREGNPENINLGFDSLEGYLGPHPHFGATIGRFANRIGGASFSLDGETYTLAANNGPNTLHGGIIGYGKVMWESEPVEVEGGAGIRFHYLSADGEEGFPGNLDVEVLYILTDGSGSDDHLGELRIEYRATTDKATPINLTNHCYWNLSGAGEGKVLDHIVRIAADHYLPVDEELIPTGKVATVENTPFDLREPVVLGEQIEQLPEGEAGFDHCFVLSDETNELALAARVRDPDSGRVMIIETTQPAVQFYTGNFLDGSEANGGYPQHGAFCLETQHYPDSPNKPQFPSTILRPGEQYEQITVHRFGIED